MPGQSARNPSPAVTFAAALVAICAAAAIAPCTAIARPGAPVERVGARVSPIPVAVSPVVVSSTSRFERKPFEVDRSVQSVDAKSLRDLQASSAPEALHETTGVLVQKSNRGAGSPMLRGLIGPNNVLVVDGVRFNNATFRTGPNQYLAMLDPVSFARYEVMMGPASVFYGSDAMGGVLQAVPHPWPKEGGGAREAGLRLGSADRATAVWGRGAWQGQGTGVQVAGALRRFGTLRAGGGEEQAISSYLQGGWSMRARHEVAPGTHVGVAWFGARIRDAGRADRIATGDFRFYDNDDDLAWLEVRHKGRGKLREARLVASVHRTDEEVDRYRCTVNDAVADVPLCSSAAVAQRGGGFGANNSIPSPDLPLTRQTGNNDKVWSPGGLAIAQFALMEGQLMFSGGAEGQVDRVTSSSKKDRRTSSDWAWKDADRGNFSNDSTYTTVATFVHAELDLLEEEDDVLVANAGVRLSHFSAHADAVPGVGDLDYSHTGLVGTAGLRWLHGDDLMAYLNASQGFRAPNLQEVTVLGDTGSKFEVPNADLNPERSNALELGGRWRRGDAQIHVAAFVNLVDDVIDEQELNQEQWQALPVDPQDIGDKKVVQRINSASGTFIGAEVTLKAPRIRRLQPWLRAAWIRGEIERRGETVPARRSPPPLGAAGLRWDAANERWHAELFSRFAAAQTRLHPSDESDLRICADPATPGKTFAQGGGVCPGSPAWVTLNARAGYAFTPTLRLDASLNNALDTNYRYHGSGFDEAGVGVTASLSGRF